jgi:hypothetical protein
MERYLGDYFSVLSYGLFGVVATSFLYILFFLVMGLFLLGFIKVGKAIFILIRESMREPGHKIIRKCRNMGKKSEPEKEETQIRVVKKTRNGAK